MSFPADLQAVVEAASGDEEGAPCSNAVRERLLAAMERRRGADAPPAPALGPLIVRRDGLPDWWGPNNLLLTAPGVEPCLKPGLVMGPRVGNVGVIGSNTSFGGLVFVDTGGLIVIGDDARIWLSELAVMNGGTILIGERTTARPWARVDARNGGAILVGADGMWADRVNIVTDDMHAIREVESGKRTNRYGGRIVLERRVWLCEAVRIMGGAHVGAESVVGLDSVVRSALPAGSVCVGSPAKPIRLGVTWTREDLP